MLGCGQIGAEDLAAEAPAVVFVHSVKARALPRENGNSGSLRRRGSEVEAVSQDSDKLVHDEDTYPKTAAPRCCGYCWPQSIHSWSTEPISKLRLSADTSCSSCKTRS